MNICDTGDVFNGHIWMKLFLKRSEDAPTVIEGEDIYESVQDASIDTDKALRVMGRKYILYINKNAFSAVGLYLKR